MKRKKDNIRGTSLLEVTIAVAIISIGAIVLVAQLETSYKINGDNRETNKAMAHLESAMEKVVNTTFSNIVTMYPHSSSVYLSEIDYSDLLPSEHIVVTHADSDADPLEVMVTITWTSFDGRDKSRTITTVVTR